MRWLHELAKGKAAMNDDGFDKQPLTPASNEEAADRAVPPLPETPVSRPGEQAPVAQTGERSKIAHWLLVSLGGLLVLAVLVGGLGLLARLTQRRTPPTQRPVATTFHSAPCPFTPAPGLLKERVVHCGYLTVPEDHRRPAGPTLRLAVAIFKAAASPAAADPVLFLNGGPGPGTLGGWPNTAADLRQWPVNRDLILFDQRGTGYSQPQLSCPEVTTSEYKTYLQAVRACHDRLVREKINLNAYTTIQNAADVHDLVRALGYQQVNLYGVSYGTGLALTVMRLFPADLRSVVLDSTSPPQVNYLTDQPATIQRAFDTLFQGCAASPTCNQKYPHLHAVFAQLVTELNQRPLTAPPLTGESLIGLLFDALSTTALIPKLPKLIYQIHNHDYTLLSQLEAAPAPTVRFSLGMRLSILCSEDGAFITPQRLQASVQVLEPEIRPAVLAAFQQDYEVCQAWGVQPIPAVQKQAVTSAIPTLILSGQYDPQTSPAYGKLAAQSLSKSYFFLFPGVSHAVLFSSDCAASIVHVFWQNPTRQPDADCLQRLGPPRFE